MIILPEHLALQSECTFFQFYKEMATLPENLCLLPASPFFKSYTERLTLPEHVGLLPQIGLLYLIDCPSIFLSGNGKHSGAPCLTPSNSV
jgi:hypothetical protein